LGAPPEPPAEALLLELEAAEEVLPDADPRADESDMVASTSSSKQNKLLKYAPLAPATKTRALQT